MKGSGDSLKDGHNVRATTTKQGTRRERDATTDFFRTPIGRGVWICRHGLDFFLSSVDLKPWTTCPLKNNNKNKHHRPQQATSSNNQHTEPTTKNFNNQQQQQQQQPKPTTTT